MIDAVLDLLAPGGVLVYVDMLGRARGERSSFQELQEGCDRVALGDHLPEGMPWTETDAGGVRILPHEHGDGFTVHALRCRS